MTLTVLFCIAWMNGGSCIQVMTVHHSIAEWSPVHCIRYVAPRFRPLVVSCVKRREVAA